MDGWTDGCMDAWRIAMNGSLALHFDGCVWLE
jgi:hypothetical protein